MAELSANQNIFVNRFGKAMPYDNSSIFQVDSDQPDIVSSEKMRYVEIIICRDDGSKESEKYAVNAISPDHDCGANCHCIQNTVLLGSPQLESLKFETPQFESTQPASTQLGGLGSLAFSSPSSALDTSDSGNVSSSTSTFESEDTTEDLKVKITLHGGAKKKAESKKEVEEGGESDDVDADLDIEEEAEEAEEGGIMMEHSSISTSDLYRMQNKIFGSNTPSDANDMSENASLTEEVEQALKNINRNKQMLSSEEKSILDMSSEMQKLMTKSPALNGKYN